MKTRINGFTLLEMMVVIIIVCLLSTGAWHSWQRWQQHQQLKANAQQIQQLLQRLRSDANWHNVERLLWMKPGARWCLGSGNVADVCPARAKFSLLAPWPEVSMQSLTVGMGFYGKKNMARPGSIVISGKAGERRIIVSSRGRIRICSLSEEQCR